MADCNAINAYRGSLLRIGPTLAPALLALAAQSCGNGASTPVSNRPKDNNGTESIVVDEAKLVGEVDGQSIKLNLEVKAAGNRAVKGALKVALRSVDDAKELSSVNVPYSVSANGTQGLSAKLSLPPDVKTQSDWVKYNVRITDGADQGLRVTRSLEYAIGPYVVAVEGPSSVSLQKTAYYRVKAWKQPSHTPLGDVPVTLDIRSKDTVVKTITAKTSQTGDASVEVSLPDAGTYTLAASTDHANVTTGTEGSFSITLPSSKLLLTTDKPIYQPGQTIHLRALALNQGTNAPLANKAATFEVQDGKGNKILKRDLTTDAYGIASTDFAIGSVVNMGDFKVRVLVGSTESDKTVTVSRYALPKFKVGIKTDRSWYKAGDTVVATIDSGYYFGKPVSGGTVQIEASTLDVASTVFQTVTGQLDASGHYAVNLKLPSALAGLPINNGNAMVDLKVTVSDTAKQVVEQHQSVTVSKDGIDVALVPENTVLVPDIENTIDLFVTDPMGSPVANAIATVTPQQGDPLAGTTDAYGHATLTYVPSSSSSPVLTANVQVPQGAITTRSFNFQTQQGSSHIILRTDKAVYGTGDNVEIQILSDAPTGNVYVDWINGGQTVDMRTLTIQNGAASFAVPIDTTLAGANRIEAYVTDSSGNIARAGRTIYARAAGGLSVNMTTDKPQYSPGETANVTFSLADEAGKPVVGALGVQVVDEAVFGLIDAKPGLLRTYFDVEQAFATPSYEIHPPPADIEDLVFNATRVPDTNVAAAAQVKTRAAFAALGDTMPVGISANSWPDTLAKSKAALDTYVTKEKAALQAILTPIVKGAMQSVESMGCTPDQYYCSSLNNSYSSLVLGIVVDNFKGFDFWGNQYTATTQDWAGLTLTSKGPDEIANDDDDIAITFSYQDLGFTDSYLFGAPVAWAANDAPPQMAGGGGAAAVNITGTGTTTTATDPNGAESPRVRKDFPETLFFRPSVITGPDGVATLGIPLADSITSWRVSSLANSLNGQLGGGVGGITVFQDFFTDINFPATLTRGDEVTFPVAIYNYLDQPQTVTLSLEPAAWYTPLGNTTFAVAMAAGEVKGVEVPVRVEKVGTYGLTVKAIGTKRSDAVQRMVQVIPDGKEISTTKAGALGASEVALPASFPATAIAGSQQLRLDIYPASIAQVVAGMDSLLREPTGCFEQTTSSTWPNVLVLDYLKKINQLTPATQLKAESLISAGYQRLLTFEHPSGGFSWFGTQDPAPFLSVTAFGIMEFSDMSKVALVDPAMLKRTIDWMKSKQAADGSWEGDQSEFFSFQTSKVRNTAFVAWALAAAGETGGPIDRALGYVRTNLAGAEDSYTLGVAANAFAVGAPNDTFTATLLSKLDAAKSTDNDKVFWSAAGTQTSFYGSGDDANVTSTALATQALLVANGYESTVKGALNYLASKKDTLGNFGSTQATIWTLRALLLSASRSGNTGIGTLTVSMDGAPFTTLDLTPDQSTVMRTVDLGSFATTGDHLVSVAFSGTGNVNYNLVSTHNIPWASAPAESGPLSISLGYDRTNLAVNDTVTATVNVTNNTVSTQNMVMVTLGIPPGFQVVTDDLLALQTADTLSQFEMTGRQLILYVSKIGPSSILPIQYRLTATMPINAADGGGKTYPYYEPVAKAFAPSTNFVVTQAL